MYLLHHNQFNVFDAKSGTNDRVVRVGIIFDNYQDANDYKISMEDAIANVNGERCMKLGDIKISPLTYINVDGTDIRIYDKIC